MRRYLISGGDNGAYGPAFGPVCADEGVRLDDGLLLRLCEALVHDNDPVEWLAVKPRYTGQSVAALRDQGCVVGIWRVLPGQAAAAGEGLSSANSQYWAVGRCEPIES